jgi:hypothetical protein
MGQIDQVRWLEHAKKKHGHKSNACNWETPCRCMGLMGVDLCRDRYLLRGIGRAISNGGKGNWKLVGKYWYRDRS